MPMKPENPKASTIDSGDTTVGQPDIEEMTIDVETPVMMPMMPPMRDRVSASMMNCSLMSHVFAPMAMRMPISRVRSVTDTSMMFMMPMPPTRSETDAMAPRSRVITFVD